MCEITVKNMDNVTKLLKIIPSPFSSKMYSLKSRKEALELYEYAKANRISLLYLESIENKREMGLQSEYIKEKRRYEETLTTVLRLSKALNPMKVDYVFFKTLKPFPSTPKDIDLLFFGSDRELDLAKTLLADFCIMLEKSPKQTMLYDIRGGVDRMNRYKKGGIYYVDLYEDAAASYVVYMDRRKLQKHVSRTLVENVEIPILAPEAELAIILIHSIIPEQLYTLSDYYATLHYLARMNQYQVESFFRIIRENHLLRAVRSSISLTAQLHRHVHGFIPELLKKGLVETQKAFPNTSFTPNDVPVLPCKYSLFTVLEVLMEKASDESFRKSVVVQTMHMYNPRLAKWVIGEIIRRRKRGTY